MSAITHHIEHTAGKVSVVQLTDTHLCRTPGGKLLGMDTDHSLQAVIELVRQERPGARLVLGTGDLSDQGAKEAYERLREYFDQLNPDYFLLPGNHDDRVQMESAIQHPARLAKTIYVGSWQILMLDSQIPGEVGGSLGSDELERLRLDLEDAREQGLYTLVCLHHQPVPVGCAWLDEQMVADADAFFNVLDDYPGVRGVLWGHVHQRIDQQRKGVALMASPSTCVQFAPGSAVFRAEDEAPGYRWLELGEDGSIDSGISRVRDVQFTVDLESGGYL